MILNSNLFIVLVAVLFFTCLSCRNKDKETAGSVYPAYIISAAEGTDNLVITAQLKSDTEFGEAISLNPPSGFTLDGEPLVADTARFGGVYYEIFKPVDGFSGRHKLAYTDKNSKVSAEEFLFEPFTLETTIPETVSRGDIKLQLAGISDREIIRVVMVDTSFGSEGINYADTVKNGKLLITNWQLSNLEDGPVKLELTREYERYMSNNGSVAGKISFYYTLQREFILKTN